MKEFLLSMKKAVLTFTLCLCCVSMSAQDHMTFQGIPIDGNIWSFADQMKKRGFKLDEYSDFNSNSITFRGRYLNKKDNVTVYCSPKSKTVYLVIVSLNDPQLLKSNSWDYLRTKMGLIVGQFMEQYNLTKVTGYTHFEPPYKEGDGNEIFALLNNKLTCSNKIPLQHGDINIFLTKSRWHILQGKPYSKRKDLVPIIAIGFSNKQNVELNEAESAVRL